MIKKVITLLSLVFIAAACNIKSPETVQQQIKNKKDKVKEINEQIALLEESLQEDNNTEVKFRIPVSIKEMQPEPFKHFIEITGKLEAEEDAFISPEMNGQVKRCM